MPEGFDAHNVVFSAVGVQLERSSFRSIGCTDCRHGTSHPNWECLNYGARGQQQTSPWPFARCSCAIRAATIFVLAVLSV